jgi:hypothetical protein
MGVSRLVRALLFGLVQSLQVLWRAVRDPVGRGLRFRSTPQLRFPHTPQVYDIAHGFLIRNSEFNSKYQ